MHILQLVPSLRVGGVERGVVDISRGLIGREHKVSVVSSGGVLVDSLKAMGVNHYTLPVDKKSPSTIFSSVGPLAEIIRANKVDIVHARSRVPGWIGCMAARRTERPFITTAHGFYSKSLGSRVMVWGRFVIAPSDSLGRYLIEHFGLSKARLRVIPRGVDLESFTYREPRPRPDAWRIGLFGRLSAIKGHAVALRACARLIQQGVPLKLVIVGDTPDAPLRPHLAALAELLRIAHAIEWMGLRQDVPQCLANVDLVVVPSIYSESFGRAAVEAQAVGRPVVASRIGALAEIIEEGKTGLLVPPQDDDALAQAIRRFIQEDALRADCVRAARARVESEFSLDRMVERTLDVYDECLTRPRVLVWKLSALGDVILSTPSLRALRVQFPKSHITLVVGRSAHEVVARCPYVDEVVIDSARGGLSGWRKRVALIRRLRGDGYDISVDFQNSRWTHTAAWLCSIRRRIGYDRKGGNMLTQPVPMPGHALAPVKHQSYLLEHAGLAPIVDERLELWLSEAEEQSAERLLAGKLRPGVKGIVGLHPGGSGRWKTKRWPIERWAHLCEQLMQNNLAVVVTGAPDERELANTLLRTSVSTPIVLVGQTTLMELACLIRRCDVFVTHDSSPLHLAAAVGTPTLAIFGPTDPRRHLPPAFNGQVLKHDVYCSPCYSSTCRTITHACMRKIEVDDVVAAVLALARQTTMHHGS